MQVKIKKLTENAVIPKYSLEGDAGLDLTATSKKYDEFGNVHYGTGLAFEIPEGFVGLLFPRSSNSKKDLILSNSVGVIDSNFRGEVSLKFKPAVVCWSDEYTTSIGRDTDSFDEIAFPSDHLKGMSFQEYEVGDRAGQLIILPYPKIEFIETDDLGETNRGDGGYGHTGN